MHTTTIRRFLVAVILAGLFADGHFPPLHPAAEKGDNPLYKGFNDDYRAGDNPAHLFVIQSNYKTAMAARL